MILKNRKSTIVLVPLVLIVWGILFWKLFVKLGGGDNVQNMPISKYQPTKDSIEFESVPTPKCNYADPFLKPLEKSTVELAKDKKKEPSKKSLNRVVRWPMIEFMGVVKSKRKKSALGILKIGRDEYLVRENDLQEGVEILSISSDSVGLKYQEDTRFFVRKGL